MFCAFCGGKNPEDALYCAFCARALRPETQPVPLSAQVPMPSASDRPAPPFAGPTTDGQYTCIVCGYILGPAEPVCPRCKTPRGLGINPASATPGDFMPFGSAVLENTSGQRGSVPAEIARGWNWGAFWFGGIWGLAHGRVWMVISFLPWLVFWLEVFMNLGGYPARGAWLVIWLLFQGVAIWFGVKGNSWAWQYRRFQSVEHFRQVQRQWAYWTLGMFLVSAACLALLLILVMMMGFAMMNATGGRMR